MLEFGNFSLALAWGFALIACFAGVLSGSEYRSRPLLECARRATICAGLFLLLSLFALGALFLKSDFTNQFVWQFSDKNMPSLYKVTAVWGGMDGSMLLWATILGVMGILMVSIKHQSLPPKLFAWSIVTFHTTLLFFTSVVLFATNPFRYIRSHIVPLDGNGLNPLLQNPYMAAHPPTLYLGFTTFAIPYAFCIGALLARDSSNSWLYLTRRWTLIAWAFLTTGIVLGGHWAYLELGWGGFWAWDPVENSSFLPWLTATAFLHSVMVQERKNMLKVWNVILIALTYGLTVFGTFLTRSGIVQSIHAFAATDIGWLFLVYLIFILLSTIILIFSRRDLLAPERNITSFWSRETFFLLNNLVFLSIAFAVVWGVMFPVLSEGLTGKQQTVGIPYFNAVTIPLFLLMLLLMGLGPAMPWHEARWPQLKAALLWPLSFGVALGALSIFIGAPSYLTSAAYGISAFVIATLFAEFHRGMKREKASPVTLVRRHPSKYGGFIVHFGILIMAIAITASMAHKVEEEFSLSIGESFTIRRYSLTLNDIESVSAEAFSALVASVSLKNLNSSNSSTLLAPEIRRYARNGESTTEVALRSTLREDVYLVLAGLDESGKKAAFKVFINPLQNWVWFGLIVVLVGTIGTLLPLPKRNDAHA
jgi:cytochrome c-type biogenesis protein CcmF